MTRETVAFSLREALTSGNSDVVPLAFLTITHPSLSEAFYFVSDGVDFTRGGVTWTGIPFDITFLSDNERPPISELTIQNVDRVIGERIKAIGIEPCRVKLEILSSADFDETVEPRAEIGTAHVHVLADHLFLVNVHVDVLSITGTLKSWDYTQELYPAYSATKDRLPGLFK